MPSPKESTPRWIFQRLARGGGTSGNAAAGVFEGGGWRSNEDLLARETIQNSVDAWSKKKGTKPKVVFRLVTLTGVEKKNFLASMHVTQLHERLAVSGLTATCSVAQASNAQTPLTLLYIEDYNTVGLCGGREDPRGGHFYRFFYLLGDGDKAESTEHSGGSYGFGKGAYAGASDSALFAVMSRFEPSAASEGCWARTMGSTSWKQHHHHDKYYTGRGYLGLPFDDKESWGEPIENDAALAFGESLGFSERNAEQAGTSVLIVGAGAFGESLSLDRLRESIETWWWPRLLADQLDIELWNGETREAPPRPTLRKDLKPYIDCFRAIRDQSVDGVYVPIFNKRQGLQLGSMGLVRVDSPDTDNPRQTDAADDDEDPAVTGPGSDKIALIRSPLMVVNYDLISNRGGIPICGTFVAAEDVDGFLRFSEPPPHNRWDKNSRRLSPDARACVEAILKRYKHAAKDFKNSLEPPKPKLRPRLEWVERAIADMFKARDKGPPPPPVGERGPISIRFLKNNLVREGGRARLVSTLRLEPKPNSTHEKYSCLLNPRLWIVEGEAGARGDGVSLTSTSHHISASGQIGPIVLARGSPVDIDLESTEYDPHWVTTLDLEVDPKPVDTE